MAKGIKETTQLYIGRIKLLIFAALILGSSIYTWSARTLAGNQLPMPFGIGLSVVLSGSMEPALSVDDLVVIGKAEEVEVGDVLVYQSGKRLVIHRLLEIDGDYLTLQGDANNTADRPIHREAVRGKLLFAIPGVGAAVRVVRQPVAIAVIWLLVILLVEMSYHKEKEKEQEELDALQQEIKMLIDEIKNKE